MRVGILTYGLDRTPTGIGRLTVESLRALAVNPDSPEIVLLTTEREDHHGLWDRFEHHALPGCRLLPSLMTFGNLAIANAMRRYRLDLIHDPNGIAPFLGLHAGTRRIVTIHDAFAYVLPETHNRLDNWRFHYQLPRIARGADAVLTVSECSRRDLLDFLGLDSGRVRVISEGVDPRFKPIEDGTSRRVTLTHYTIKQPYILSLGGINARKNIARLFEAYAKVREQFPDVILVVAGKRQWQTGDLDATLQKLNLMNHVHFTGYVDDADLPALYSSAELFVFPSLYEGFGLPPLEAMACGTPVVTSNSSSLPEVVGDAALLVDPHNVDAIADAICRLLEDPSLAADLKARGLMRAREFTWERAAKQMITVYEQVMQRSPVSSQA